MSDRVKKIDDHIKKSYDIIKNIYDNIKKIYDLFSFHCITNFYVEDIIWLVLDM